jgi:hypothetical protein
MESMRRLSLRLLAPYAAVVVGCSLVEGPETICTLIGCESGLHVRLETLPAGAVKIEVFGRSSDGMPAYTYDCTASSCDQTVFFPGLILEQGSVRVTSSAGSRTTAIRPFYVSHRPNGPDCPPDCRQATVTVPI